MNKNIYKFLSISALLASIAIPAVGAMELNEENTAEKTAKKTIKKNKNEIVEISPHTVGLLKKFCKSEFPGKYKSNLGDDEFIPDREYNRALRTLKNILLDALNSNYLFYNASISKYTDEHRSIFLRFMKEYKDKIENLDERTSVYILLDRLTEKSEDQKDQKDQKDEKYETNLLRKKRRLKEQYGCEDYQEIKNSENKGNNDSNIYKQENHCKCKLLDLFEKFE